MTAEQLRILYDRVRPIPVDEGESSPEIAAFNAQVGRFRRLLDVVFRRLVAEQRTADPEEKTLLRELAAELAGQRAHVMFPRLSSALPRPSRPS